MQFFFSGRGLLPERVLYIVWLRGAEAPFKQTTLVLLTISELKALAVVGHLINHNIKVLHMSLYDLTIL